MSYAPSFWNPAYGAGQYGIPESAVAKQSKLPLKDVLGTYRWVWSDEGDEELTYEESDRNQEPDKRVLDELVLESLRPGNAVKPSSIKGQLDSGGFHLSFEGLVKIDPKRHVYELSEVDLQDEYTKETLQEEENLLEFLDIKDDNGFPFIKFTWNGGYSGCAPCTGWLLGKRWNKESGWKDLSDKEKAKFGMDAEIEELEKRWEEEQAAAEVKVKNEGRVKKRERETSPTLTMPAAEEKGSSKKQKVDGFAKEEQGQSSKVKAEI